MVTAGGPDCSPGPWHFFDQHQQSNRRRPATPSLENMGGRPNWGGVHERVAHDRFPELTEFRRLKAPRRSTAGLELRSASRIHPYWKSG